MNRALLITKDEATSPATNEDVADWEKLADDSAESNPFYHPALLRPALAHFGQQQNVRLIEARHQGELIGLMPVTPQARHSRYPFPNISNWDHDHIFYGAPLLRRGQEAAAWAALLAQLDRAPWAGCFLHLTRMDPDGAAAAGLRACCAAEKRPMKQIGLYERAMLQSDLSADDYWTTHVRSKKRKELRRLVNRLSECGTVAHQRLENPDQASAWAQDFMALEASGWKGQQGTALINNAATKGWFETIIRNSAASGMLDMLRIDVDDTAIAMLVNFRHGRGAYSYKIAFDENYARYSPGILIEIDNLHGILAGGASEVGAAPRPIDWMDSCAAPDHPMIDSLWGQRRSIAQYRVGLKGGLIRPAAYTLTDTAEKLLRFIRKDKS